MYVNVSFRKNTHFKYFTLRAYSIFNKIRFLLLTHGCNYKIKEWTALDGEQVRGEGVRG